MERIKKGRVMEKCFHHLLVRRPTYPLCWRFTLGEVDNTFAHGGRGKMNPGEREREGRGEQSPNREEGGRKLTILEAWSRALSI